jgi:cytochrome P450
MPEWSWIGGHLLVLRHYLDSYPPDTFVNIIATHMARDLGNPDMFYLDLWPFLAPNLMVNSPEVATQVSNKLNLPKPPMYGAMFDPMNGGPSILTMNGKEWKHWRTLFNPGFASSYLLEQVPAIVGSIEIYCDQLKRRTGTVFRLEDVTTRMTMEVIIKTVL